MESENKLSQITYYELKRDEETKNIQALHLSIASIDNKLAQAGDPNTSSGTSKNEKILELRKKINELNQIYIDGGSKDAKLKSTIENLQERLQLEMAATPVVNGSAMSADEIARLKSEREDNRLKLKIAESNLQSVNNTLWGLKGNISGYANKETTLSNLQLEVQRAADEYADALDKFNVEKSKSMISNIAIKPILSAQPAGEPESNKTMLKTALAFIVSLIICIVGIVMVEFFDLSIKTQTQFHRMTKLDLSGVLNNIKHTANLNLSQVFSAEDTKPEHKTFKHLIRKIRYEIEKENPQVILVTSTQEKVGKSFLIVSLSYSLSLINKRVLIVDTNFKNNTLSKLLLAKQNDQKLLKRAETMKSIGPHGDHVEEETAEDVNFNSIISKTAHRNVFVIGSKKSSDSPSEILSGRHFEELLVDLRKNYDYIFLEGAALNDYSDTKELVLYADKVLPVFSAETVIKEADKESIRFLRSLNGKIMGAVLNKVNEKDMKL
jgi:Mrp family chromosome partitioning ATPase